MSTIQVKRGNNTNLSTLKLNSGEPAFVLDTGKLYIGNGTSNILINPDPQTSTNAESANKLTTPRTISATGDVTGSTTFDGSANSSMSLTLASSGVTAGTYSKVTVDGKGRVTSGATLSATDIPSLSLSKISDINSIYANPTFSGTVILPTPSEGDNSTKGATTAFVNKAISNIDGGTF